MINQHTSVTSDLKTDLFRCLTNPLQQGFIYNLLIIPVINNKPISPASSFTCYIRVAVDIV